MESARSERVWRRPLAVAALTLTVAMTAPPSSAAPQTSWWDRMRADTAARLDRVSALAGSGSLADAVRAASALVEVAPVRLGASPVPAGLPAPVAELLGAVLRAGRVARASVTGSPAELESLVRRAEALGERDGSPVDGLLGELDAMVDRPRLYGAAVSLAEAIDDALPALAAMDGAETDTCEYGEVVVCVGGTGPDTYTSDFALIIDQGGDDTYTNSAGAADPLGNGLPASVVIDLGGNDSYTSTVPSSTGAGAVQGAASIGGIGILLDAAGNDVYDARVTGENGVGQGVGFAGVGILADLAGNDAYRMANESPVGDTDSESADGQANANAGGIGVLVDRTGDDSFTLRSNPTPSVDGTGTVHIGAVTAQGQGYANIGSAAILAAGDGTDAISLEAIAGPVAADETRPVTVETVRAWGLGFASVGAGAVVLGGSGSTSYRSTVEITTPQSYAVGGSGGIAAQWLGHAMAQGGALGAITDTGGDDVYRTDVTGTVSRRVTVDDSCDCGRAVHKATGGQAAAFALARASTGGAVGMIRDLSGNDRYTTRVTSVAEMIVRDERTVAPEPDPETGLAGPRATANPLNAAANGQGLGRDGSPGFLHDYAGNDVYESYAKSEARAEASAALPELDAEAEAEANGFTAKSLAQGAADFGGYGELRDLGGTDSYISANTSTGTASPPTHADGGFTFSTVQGSAELGATASFADIDGAAYQYDTFTAIPEDPTTTGVRGEGVWVDSVYTTGTGTIPSGGTGVNA